MPWLYAEDDAASQTVWRRTVEIQASEGPQECSRRFTRERDRRERNERERRRRNAGRSRHDRLAQRGAVLRTSAVRLRMMIRPRRMGVRRAIVVGTRLPGARVVMRMRVGSVGGTRHPRCFRRDSRCQAHQHLKRPEDREGEGQRSQRDCSNPGSPARQGLAEVNTGVQPAWVGLPGNGLEGHLGSRGPAIAFGHLRSPSRVETLIATSYVHT